jgi:preprotein translocase subunit SecE
VAVNPTKFIREVRSEVAKVTWPTRRETMVTTGLVLAMTCVVAVLLFALDQAIGLAVRSLFRVGA